MKLTEKEFLGKILKNKDPKNQGRYCVHIPDLMLHLPEDEGIFVKNQIHKNRITPSDSGNYGQYFPLQPNTLVIIKFFEDDYNTGYIDRIISDFKNDSLPLLIKDRDDFHQIFRTPKYDNIFTIHENTTDQAPNSIHLYFNKYRTTIVVDEEGIHIHSDDNEDKKILKNSNINIKQNKKLHIQGNYDIYVDGETKIFSSGAIHMRSATTINMDAPTINLNCGYSATAEKAKIPTRKTNFLERSQKSDTDNTRMLIKIGGRFADFPYFQNLG